MAPFTWAEMYFVKYGRDLIPERSRVDLRTLRTKLEVPPVDPVVLAKMFIMYGPSPRHCYTLANDEVAWSEFERQIPAISAE